MLTKRERGKSNCTSLVYSCVLEDRCCEGLMHKSITYKKVVSKTVNSRMRRITNKCGLQKGLNADKNNELIVGK